MLVFWAQRLTILAVPKTGSTAYEAALGPHADMIVRAPPELKHAPLYRYNRFFRPMFEKQGASDMETLAVMRHPVAWLSSWYRYRSRPAMHGQANATSGIDFNTFVDAHLQDPPPGFADVGSQARFLAPRPNGTRVHHLFRYDDQAALKAFLEDRLGLRFTLPRANVSPEMPVDLSEGLALRLQRDRAADFALHDSIPDGGLHDADPKDTEKRD